METKILRFLPSKTPQSTIATAGKASSTKQRHISLPRRQHSVKLNATNNSSSSSSSSNDLPPLPPPTMTSPSPPPELPQAEETETVQIRYRRGARKRMRQKEEKTGKDKASAPVVKKWEEMSFTEKAIELYVGEKGMLFWLNKFAYASIYIVIGAWILFRFVGPALNLYQLDTTPLPPSAMFKG